MLLPGLLRMVGKQQKLLIWWPFTTVFLQLTYNGQYRLCLRICTCLIFYARQLYRQVLLRARISYGDSDCPSVWDVTTRYRTKPKWDRDSGSSPYDSLESLVSNEILLVPLDEELPIERGHQRGVPPLEMVILPLLTHLAWKRLQIDTDLLHIITSTADELFRGTNIYDLERPSTPKIWVLSEFFAILGCDAHLEWIFTEIYWR